MGCGQSQFGITIGPERQNSLSGVRAGKWVVDLCVLWFRRWGDGK